MSANRQAFMEKEQREEWDRLEQQAMQTLRTSGVLAQSREYSLFHILVCPAFEDAFSWEVGQRVERSGGTVHFAVHQRWNKRVDYEKLRTPVVRLQYPRLLTPTLTTQRKPLEADRAAAMLMELASISIPVYVKAEGVGLDGISYEFT